MDGLIKDLMGVALGHPDGHDHDQSSSPSYRDERSRSIWSQVVSGEPDNGDRVTDNNEPRRHPHAHQTNQWTAQEENQDWKIEGSRTSRRSRKEARNQYDEINEGNECHDYNQNRWDRKEDEGKKEENGGWETVGKKHPKRQHRVMNYVNVYLGMFKWINGRDTKSLLANKNTLMRLKTVKTCNLQERNG